MKIMHKSLLLLVAICYSSLLCAQDSAVFNAAKGTWSLYYQEAETNQWVKK